MFPLAALVLLWFVLTVHRTLFWLWLWQVKEYRLDRLFAEFPGSKLLALLFPGALGLRAVLLAVLAVWVLFGRDPAVLVWAGVGLYGLDALRVGIGIAARFAGIARPVFTVKASLMGLSALGVGLALVAASPQLLAGLLLTDLFLPFLIFVLVLAFKIPTALARQTLLAKAKKKRRGLPNLFVIGITGSFGKTSTKEFLAALLARRFRVLKVPEHVNSEIALARFLIRELKATHEILVAELGAYRKGEIRRLAEVLKPALGIITGINEQHLALFGSLEKIKAAKYELIEALPAGGLAIFNGDTEASRALYEVCARPKKLFSTESEADCYAEDIRMENNMLVFQLKADGDSRTMKAPLFGTHHVPNILAATTAALSLGLTLDEIREGVQYLRPPGHTMALRKDAAGRFIIDDTYSANPDGVLAALETLRLFPDGKKLLVMPSLIELGEASTRIHETIGRKIAEVCDLAIITTFAGFAAIERGIGSQEKAVYERDPQKILALIKAETKAGDAILLESRVPEGVRVVLRAS